MKTETFQLSFKKIPVTAKFLAPCQRVRREFIPSLQHIDFIAVVNGAGLI